MGISWQMNSKFYYNIIGEICQPHPIMRCWKSTTNKTSSWQLWSFSTWWMHDKMLLHQCLMMTYMDVIPNNWHLTLFAMTEYIRVPGPCLTTATWRCCKKFSQWERSFQRKLCCHWMKRLRQRQIDVVRQAPAIGVPAGTRRNNNVFTTSTRRRRRRVDVVKALSLRHYWVMCPLMWHRWLG